MKNQIILLAISILGACSGDKQKSDAIQKGSKLTAT